MRILSDKDGKTEKPTPKRLRDAREEGQIPKSQDLTSAISFIIFAYLLTLILTYTFEQSYFILERFLSFNVNQFHISNDMGNLGVQIVFYFFIIVGPALLIAFLSGFIGNLIQVGFVFVTKALKPSFDRLNPVTNLKNMFGKQAIFQLAKNLAKLGIILLIAYQSTSDAIYTLFNLPNFGTQKVFFILIDLMKDVGIRISIFLIVIGIADFVYQRYEHHKNLKMSQQEIKDEFKEMEGDPQVKQERKQRYREMVSGNIRDVQDATVLITNPTHFAIAIRYDRETHEDEAPIVLVKGADHIALKMREIAEEHEVPMIENKELARNLYKNAEVGAPIPIDLYQTIAEILAIIIQNEEMQKRKI